MTVSWPSPALPGTLSRFTGEGLSEPERRLQVSASDCVDEVEVCVTMVDEDDAEVRLCLNDSPGDRDQDKTHRASSRR